MLGASGYIIVPPVPLNAWTRVTLDVNKFASGCRLAVYYDGVEQVVLGCTELSP
jgi:hypothetical protein